MMALRNILLLSVVSSSCFSARTSVAQGGVPLWTNRFDGTANGSDYANFVTVDTSGNVYVTGSSRGPINNDYATIKYSSAGVALWTNRYVGPDSGAFGDFSGDVAYCVAVDGSGNVFVTGRSDSSLGSSDYATIKYFSAGLALWTNRYNGPGSSGIETARSIVADSNGNAYITGSSPSGPGGSSDFMTIKYSSAGVSLWTQRYNGPGNSTDGALGVALDGDQNVFVTGPSIGSGTGQDFATIKYSNTGVPIWTNRYNGTANGADSPAALGVDGSGNVYVTGVSAGSGSSNDFLTVCYSNAGLPLWTNRYNGPDNGDDTAICMAVTAGGNVYVAGYSSSSNGSFASYDVVTIAYSSNGIPSWTNRYNGPAQDFETPRPNCLVVDVYGNVYVTCESIGIGSSFDYATIAYTGDGLPLWTNRYNGPANGLDNPFGMATDSEGNVYVTGYSQGIGSGYDFATIKYGPTIQLRIERRAEDAVLRWTDPTFQLQAAPSVSGPFTNIFGATNPYTNPITGEQKFFRLKSN